MIDYGKIDDCIKHYESKGYVRIETPWTVTPQIGDLTKPEGADDIRLHHNDNKVLVASGEQSFLYLYNKGFLPKGKFQTVTPCFRSDSFGPFHTKYFIKNELIITDEVSTKKLDEMVMMVKDHLDEAYQVPFYILPTTPTAYDILLDDIEIGSYGIRSCPFLDWIYGTGIAEPRLSKALEHYHRRHS